MRMGSLRVYRGIEDGGKRGNPDEGAVQRGSSFTITFGPVPEAGIHEPIVIQNPIMVRVHSDDLLERVHVLCLNTLRMSQAARYGVLRLPRHMWHFGDYAVMMRGAEFFDAIQRHCEDASLTWAAQLVTYVSDDHSGEWGIFMKAKKYSEQREYRIAIRRPDGEESTDYMTQKIPPPWAQILSTRAIGKLAYPCLQCDGSLQGIAAPDRRRGRRVQKKIDSRLGAGRTFQVCRSCRLRVKFVPHGGRLQLRALPTRHRRVSRG